MGNINENGNIDNIKYSYYDWMSHNPLENEELKNVYICQLVVVDAGSLAITRLIATIRKGALK